MRKKKSINYIDFQSVDSTNTWAKQHAAVLDPEKITCITAEEQTAGRGRSSRKWISPPNQNIYATFFFCLPKESSILPNLGQLLSVSCCKTLETLGFSPNIKWPNDILLHSQKVAGILCEMTLLKNGPGIALGIGINVNMPKTGTDRINQPATSLMQISGRIQPIDDVLRLLTENFAQDLCELENYGFAAFHDYYETRMAFKKGSFRLKDGVRHFEAVYDSLTSEGRLIVTLPSGEKRELSAGEIQPIPNAKNYYRESLEDRDEL